MKLSIITINYNNKTGLEKTIASVMSQNWRDFEWLLIDGGSTDGSKEIIETLATNPESKISYWCSEKDGGVYNAMNKGIAVSNGEFLYFLNSGDSIYEKDTLKKIFCKEIQDDIIYGDWLQVYPDSTEKTHFSDGVGIYSLKERNICQQAMFVKSGILREEGFDESYRLYADWKRWLQVAMRGGSFSYVPYTICSYDMSGMSATDYLCANRERIRIQQELFSSMYCNMFNVIDYYNETRAIVRLQAILKKGGICAIVVKAILKMMDWVFTNIDFEKNTVIGENNIRKR